MTTVIGYIRVSSAKQVTDGSGLDVQRARIAAWVAYQNAQGAGLPEPSIEADEGRSGTDPTRPGFRRAVRACLDAPDGACLIVYKLDRLGRDALDVQETLAVLLDAGVRVVSLADGVDSASGMGKALLKLLTTILASFAELERETILARSADGRARAKAEGRVYTRHAPYGFRKTDDGWVEPEPTETALIDLIRGFSAGGASDAHIVRKLATLGYTRRNGQPWTRVAVGRILRGRSTPRPSRSARVDNARLRLLG